MQDYNNPQLPSYIMGGEGGGMQSQTNQQLNAQLTTQLNCSRAAHTMDRPLTVAKGLTLATLAAGYTHC